MVVRACLFLALLALANSQRFRRSPSAIPTSTYGTSPVPSVSSAPTWTPIASDSASSSGSKSPRPSISSLPSVSETRSARVSSSQTSTAKISSEPSRSSLATTSPTFSISVTTSASASVTRTPSFTPTMTHTPCEIWYNKIFPDYQPCNPGGSQTIHAANTASTILMTVLTVVSIVLIAITVGLYYDIHGIMSSVSNCNNRFITHSIALTFSIPCCFLPLILMIMFGKTEGYDQTPYKIASGVLIGVWFFFVFFFTPIIIRIEHCCVELSKAYQRDRDRWIQWIAERRRPRVLNQNPPPIVEHPPTVAYKPDAVFVNTDPTCTICFANVPETDEEATNSDEKKTKLACGHHFHSGCISGWHAHRLNEYPSEPASCPICRANLQVSAGGSK